MGACFIERIFPPCSEADLRKAIQTQIDSDRARHGADPYSGTWATNSGVRSETRLFDLADEARDWLNEHASKRGAIVAVKIKALPEFESLPQAAPLIAAVQTAYRARTGLPKAVLERLRAAGAHVACPKCTGTVPPAFLRDLTCPICRASLLGPVDRAEDDRRKAAEDAARADMATARKAWAAAQPKEPWLWLAAAWCAE